MMYFIAFWFVTTAFAFSLFLSIIREVCGKVLDKYGAETLKKLRKPFSFGTLGFQKMLFVVACPIVHLLAIAVMLTDNGDLVDKVYPLTCNRIDELLASE